MRSRVLSLGLALTCVILIASTGCSSASRSGATKPSAAPPVVKMITTGPGRSEPLQSRVVARIAIDNPDGLAEAGGWVWVKTDDGRVVRIDPRSNKVTGAIRLDTASERHHYCQGIGHYGSDVWACAATDLTTNLVRIDPKQMRVGPVAAVGKVFDQLTVPHTARGLWVLSGTGRSLSAVAPGSGAVSTYVLPARCLQVAASEALVIATCASDNLLVSIDPDSGRVRAQIHLPAPRLALVTHDSIWVDTTDGLTRLGLDLKVRAVFSNQYAGLEGDLAASGNDLWVRGHGGVLWRIDQAGDAVVEQLSSSPALSGGSLLITQDSIWMSAGDEGYVLRLSR